MSLSHQNRCQIKVNISGIGNIDLGFLIFRILILTAVGFMLLSWFMPWWSYDVQAVTSNTVTIRPWGLENRLTVRDVYNDIPDYYMLGNLRCHFVLPYWFAPVMWTYLGLCVTALLFSMFVKGKELKVWKIRSTLPSLILGSVGFSYIVIIVLSVFVAAMRTGDFFDLKLIGLPHINLAEVQASIREAIPLPGYWLACAVGPLLIILALFRNKIVDKHRLEL